MIVEKKKKEIIELIKETKNSDYIEAIYDSLDQIKSSKDFWETLPSSQQKEIEEGLQDIREGRIVSHDEVKSKYGV